MEPLGKGTNAEREEYQRKLKAYSTHMQQASGGGSVISFETGDADFSRRLVDSVHLFKVIGRSIVVIVENVL